MGNIFKKDFIQTNNFDVIMENSPFFDCKNEKIDFPFKVMIITSSNYESFDSYFQGIDNIQVEMEYNLNSIEKEMKNFDEFDAIWVYGKKKKKKNQQNNFFF